MKMMIMMMMTMNEHCHYYHDDDAAAAAAASALSHCASQLCDKFPSEIELCSRCAVFLLRSHHAQIASTHSLLPEIAALQSLVRRHMSAFRDLIGVNLEGIRFAQRRLQSAASEHIII